MKETDDPIIEIQVTTNKSRGNPWGRPPGNSRYVLMYARWGFPWGILVGVFLGIAVAYLSVEFFFWLARNI